MFFQQPCLDLWLTSLADAMAGSAGRQIFLGAVLGSQGCQLTFCSDLDALLLESHFFLLFWRTVFVDKLSIMKTHDMAKIFPYFRVLLNVSL